MINLIIDAVTDILAKDKNAFISILGDFNRLSTSEITDLFLSIVKINTPPTRGDTHLDLILTNLPGIKDVLTTAPLETVTGICSDHGVPSICAEIPCPHLFE